MPINISFYKLQDSEFKGANVVGVVSIGRGYQSAIPHKTEAELLTLFVNRLNALAPENKPIKFIFLETGMLQRHNVDWFLAPSDEKLNKSAVNKIKVLSDEEVIQAFLALKSAPEFSLIKEKKEIENDDVAKLLGAMFKPAAKAAGAYYAKEAEPIWRKLEGHDLAVMSDSVQLKTGIIYLRMKKAKVVYTVIAPDGQVMRDVVTNIPAPSAHTLKGYAPLKEDILKAAKDASHIPQENLNQDRVLMQNWEQAIDEFNLEKDWNGDGHVYNKYAVKLKELENEYNEIEAFQKKIDGAIDNLLKYRQFDKALGRLKEIASSIDLQSIKNKSLEMFIEKIKNLNKSDIEKISQLLCRHYIFEELAQQQCYAEKTYLLYPGKVINGLGEEYLKRKIPLKQIKIADTDVVPSKRLIEEDSSQPSSYFSVIPAISQKAEQNSQDSFSSGVFLQRLSSMSILPSAIEKRHRLIEAKSEVRADEEKNSFLSQQDGTPKEQKVREVLAVPAFIPGRSVVEGSSEIKDSKISKFSKGYSDALTITPPQATGIPILESPVQLSVVDGISEKKPSEARQDLASGLTLVSSFSLFPQPSRASLEKDNRSVLARAISPGSEQKEIATLTQVLETNLLQLMLALKRSKKLEFMVVEGLVSQSEEMLAFIEGKTPSVIRDPITYRSRSR